MKRKRASAKFAVVGFSGGIIGVINFTDVNGIEAFLIRTRVLSELVELKAAMQVHLKRKQGVLNSRRADLLPVVSLWALGR